MGKLSDISRQVTGETAFTRIPFAAYSCANINFTRSAASLSSGQVENPSAETDCRISDYDIEPIKFLNDLLNRALQFVGVALINVLVRNGSKLRGTCSASSSLSRSKGMTRVPKLDSLAVVSAPMSPHPPVIAMTLPPSPRESSKAISGIVFTQSK
ncbi:MAG: hypothetical protein WAM69_09175 [Candidatus Sulfotelmatobacter sp.]